MRFFYAPSSCSIGIHILLEETGTPYESAKIALAARDQMKPEFLAVNPKGKVPALQRDDGSVLTEFQTIAYWLARSFPDAGLISDDFETQIRTLEFLDFAVGSVHMRAFTLFMVPQKFTPVESCQAEIRAYGRKAFIDGMAQISAILGTKKFVLGDYSIADAAAFYLTRWAMLQDFTLPENLAAFHAEMLNRPAVATALAKEAS
jgi:glutathione S-transferase